MSYAGESQANQGPGVLILQDHRRVENADRSMVMAARISRHSPEAMYEYASTDDYGDLTNSLFWPGKGREFTGVSWAWSSVVSDTKLPTTTPVFRPGNATSFGGSFPTGILPAGKGQRPDERYDVLSAKTAPISSAICKGLTGIALAGSGETEQDVHFHLTDSRIPLVHVNGSPSFGRLVFDLTNDNEPDEERHARLHTMMRVVKNPAGMGNLVAWNLTKTGRGDGFGGMVVDESALQTSKPKRGPSSGTPLGDRRRLRDVLSGTAPVGGFGTVSPLRNTRLPSGAAGIVGAFLGPNGGIPPRGFSTGLGAIRTISSTGGSGTGSVAIGAVSAHMGGPLHVGTNKDAHSLGNDLDGNPVNPVHITTEALFINPNATYQDGPLDLWPRKLGGFEPEYITDVRFGWDHVNNVFGWYSFSAFDISPGHRDELPKPPVSGTPRGGGGSDGVGGFEHPGDVRIDSSNPFANLAGSILGRLQSDRSEYGVNRWSSRSWLEISTAATARRAQKWGKGQRDAVHTRGVAGTMEGPTVIRSDTFAKQPAGLGGDFGYTNGELTPPYPGGTANGSLWFMPPEVTGEDYGTDFAPFGRELSSPALGLVQGTRLGFGFPSIETGGVRDGYAQVGEAGDLRFDVHDSDGVASERFRFLKDGGATASTKNQSGLLIPLWAGDWADGTYEAGLQVRDGEWLMIANKTTTDRAAPQPAGDTEYALVDSPSWTINNNTDVTVTGARYTVVTAGIITDVRVWLPVVLATTHYRVDFVNVTTGVTDVGTPFLGTILGAAGWQAVRVKSPFMLAGTQFEVRLVALETSATTNFTFDWVYIGSSNQENDPGLGNCETRQSSRVRVNDEDDGGTDRSSSLDTVEFGTILRITQDDDATKFVEYEVLSVDDNGAYFTYHVGGVEAEGSGGIPDTLALCNVKFTIPVASATDYVQLTSHWPANAPAWSPGIQGIENLSGTDVLNNNAYGVDVSFQEHDISPDWDFMAKTEGVV